MTSEITFEEFRQEWLADVRAGPQADVSALEQELDRLVYTLCGLTEMDAASADH